MLLAVDQVRVRVVTSTPGAYRSWTICPSCTTSRLSVTCSGVSRSKAQSEAAWTAAGSMAGDGDGAATRSPSGHATAAGSPAGYGRSSAGNRSTSSKVWSGARITQPTPSRNAARITGVPPGDPTATAFRASSTT